MERRAKAEQVHGKPPVAGEEEDMAEFLRQEAAYRKQFDPVAPWKRDNIPDYGPLHDKHHVLIFGLVGVCCMLFYECSGIFDQIPRWLAYLAIWFPLWFRLLGRVSPTPTDEEIDRRERKAFEQELQRIIDEKEELDE